MVAERTESLSTHYTQCVCRTATSSLADTQEGADKVESISALGSQVEGTDTLSIKARRLKAGQTLAQVCVVVTKAALSPPTHPQAASPQIQGGQGFLGMRLKGDGSPRQ